MESVLPEWAQWVVSFAPVGTFIIAMSAAVIGWRTLKQKREADARTHWWDRTKWAIDQVESGDETAATVGIRVLGLQAESPLAGAEETKVIEAVWEPIVGDGDLELPSDVEAELRYLVEGESGQGGEGESDVVR